MSASAKAKAKAEQLKGMLVEAAGRGTGNQRKVDEGRGKQSLGDLRQAVQKAKDAFKH